MFYCSQLQRVRNALASAVPLERFIFLDCSPENRAGPPATVPERTVNARMMHMSRSGDQPRTVPRAEEPWPEDFDPESIDHDESLILGMLEKTPTERLEVLQDFVEAVTLLRNGRKVSQ